MASIVWLIGANAGWNLNDIKKRAEDAARTAVGGGLTNDEVIRGLKEALSIGAKNAAGNASRLDGFYKNPRIKIPFPPEAQKVKTMVEAIGMRKQVDEFVKTLNRAAEEAAKKAAPIFLDAITGMTIQDGFEILNGPDDSATAYLKGKTTAPLAREFKPIVKAAIQKVQVTKYWNPIATSYNRVPLVKKVNPDLDDYVTKRALAGLFELIADQEKKIRKDPAARVTELLRKVFGSR
ncbi:MAG: DUF4197 domain-containing protein [Candidatus Colwellbacteria bacterium]|nr:DUF4197 domain-containing protein [Candidatus Colwellbacteria bacterium]